MLAIRPTQGSLVPTDKCKSQAAENDKMTVWTIVWTIGLDIGLLFGSMLVIGSEIAHGIVERRVVAAAI